MRQVIFNRHMELFNAGEIAGFSDEKAARFVEVGAARYWPLPEPTLVPAQVADTPEAQEAAAKMEEELDVKKALKKAPTDKMVKGAETK